MKMKLTQRTIDTLALPAGRKDAIYFDDTLPGFGIRLREAGSRMFVVQYRIGGRGRRVTLGTTAMLKVEQARTKAAELLAKVKLGGDPAGEKAELVQQAGETFAVAPKGALADEQLPLRGTVPAGAFPATARHSADADRPEDGCRAPQ
jgi:hypothetical protein